MDDIDKIDARYRLGDSITDEELDALLNTYQNAYDALKALREPSYELVTIDLQSHAERLECFKRSRAEPR